MTEIDQAILGESIFREPGLEGRVAVETTASVHQEFRRATEQYPEPFARAL